MIDPDGEVKWSRLLARAFSDYSPDPDLRMRLVEVLEQAKNEKDLPVWFLDFVKSGATKN